MSEKKITPEVITEVYKSWKNLNELHKKAEQTLLKLISHPDATDEQIVAASRVRGYAGASQNAISHKIVDILSKQNSTRASMMVDQVRATILHAPLSKEQLERLRAASEQAQTKLKEMQQNYEKDDGPLSQDQLEQVTKSAPKPKFVRTVNGIPCITLMEHEYIVSEMSPKTQKNGWIIAPAIATQEMMNAMQAAEEDGYWAMYEAALAASPQPEEKLQKKTGPAP